ncbi:MAG TPA: hypothetical protein VGT04_10565, partial [Acidobacteriaceae bacterium]|nr:hypothetical protein [Acidobacteriaceae bacterium]
QYVYDGARLLAIYTNGTTEFIHADHLGSTRLVTGVSQISRRENEGRRRSHDAAAERGCSGNL